MGVGVSPSDLSHGQVQPAVDPSVQKGGGGNFAVPVNIAVRSKDGEGILRTLPVRHPC
jgi:hypothetical protein